MDAALVVEVIETAPGAETGTVALVAEGVATVTVGVVVDMVIVAVADMVTVVAGMAIEAAVVALAAAVGVEVVEGPTGAPADAPTTA